MATAAHAESPRETVAHAVVLTDNADEQRRLVSGLAGNSDPDIPRLLNLWKESGFFIATAPAGGWQGLAEGAKVAVTLGDDKDADDKQAASVLATGAPLRDPAGQPVRLVATDLDNADTDFDLRLAMKTVLDLAAVTAADPVQRRQVVEQIGLAQDPAKLPVLRERVKVETDAHVQQALRVAIALLELRSEDAATQIAATNTLGAVRALSARDALTTLARETETTRPQVARAAQAAGKAIETHLQVVNFFGTLFRGLSLASVLLVVAIGLAITFGLMGIINMAHGELIAIGAYTTYLVQNLFGNGMALSPFGWSFRLPGLNAGGWFYESYFLFALPLSFLSAALAGVLLERCVIRFLYRRPLESLLATWGVSLVLQQLLRSVFGANNVQVYSPSWLSGHWTVFDVLLGWNRVFVIAFAVAIIAGTWALLTKTPFGLLIRAVTQNRAMAACMGVRTERVNVLTFAFGSGLAGLAGAFLAQIGNVGPSLGQNYIVDSFMTVVVGGVGNLFGTVISALGIGVTDQGLQQILGNPVLGKILVLCAIILFLQWKPAGLFVTRSRNLEG
ncbi:MAG: urea ABC transporter permease subunit UrtB [Verrucomicrobia bacterium]|nr:urea ABC transporter permease subunit UrtB [Verrucomicrobiota bacterium]